MGAETGLSRLILTLATASAGPRAADIVAAIAARLGVELEALFVDERRWLRLAEADLLQRLRAPRYEPEAIDRDALVAELQLQEIQLRRALEAAARSAGVGFSFRTVADESGDAPLAGGGEIVVVPHGGVLGHRRELVRRLLGQVAGLLLLPLPPSPIRRPAILIDRAGRGPDPGLGEFLGVASGIARQFAGAPDAQVEVVVAGPAADAAVQDAIHRSFGSRSDRLRLHTIPGGPTAPMVLPPDVDALIVSAVDLLEESVSRAKLVDASRRPVLLLRRR